MVFAKTLDKVYKIIQFISTTDGVRAICVPVYDIDWNMINDTNRTYGGYFRYDFHSDKSNQFCIKSIYELEVLPESSIPEDVKRDFKLNYILNSESTNF